MYRINFLLLRVFCDIHDSKPIVYKEKTSKIAIVPIKVYIRSIYTTLSVNGYYFVVKALKLRGKG